MNCHHHNGISTHQQSTFLLPLKHVSYTKYCKCIYLQRRSCRTSGWLATPSDTVHTVMLYSRPGLSPVNVTFMSVSLAAFSFTGMLGSLSIKRYRSKRDDDAGVGVYRSVIESNFCGCLLTTRTSDWMSGTVER